MENKKAIPFSPPDMTDEEVADKMSKIFTKLQEAFDATLRQ